MPPASAACAPSGLRAPVVPVRVRLLRPARLAALRTVGPGGPAADGTDAGRGGAGGGRRGGAGSRVGHTGGAGFRCPQRIPYTDGLVKNRTSAGPSSSLFQLQRDRGIKLKLNPIPATLAGKRVVLVDDSIVRGSTTRQLVAMTREAGAAEVHLRISSPPYRWPCFYGMDTSDRFNCLLHGCRSRDSRSSDATASPTSRSKACWPRPKSPRPVSAPPVSAATTPLRSTWKRASSSWSKPLPDDVVSDGRRRSRRSRPPCRRDSRPGHRHPG